MSQQAFVSSQQRLRSLSVRVSLWLVISAIVPLLITLAFSEWQSRPALIAQSNMAMESDAATRAQLIDTYFQERLLDAQTIAQVSVVQAFLAMSYAPQNTAYQNAARNAEYALNAGKFRDKHYTTWVLFDPQGQPRLYSTKPPQKHGQNFASPEYLQAVRSGKSFISSVYYDPITRKASVDIYSPVVSPTIPTAGAQALTSTYAGFVRSTLNLDTIGDIVNGDRGNNGSESYVFILDENGVRIADTETSELFRAIAPLPSATQQRITQEDRYGSAKPVSVLADQALAENLALPTFQIQPTGKSEAYQAVQHAISVVPWKYFVLSPVNTVTAVANQQLLITGVVAFTMSVLLCIVGLIIGRNITYPILASVNSLRDSSQTLNELAIRQQDAVSEQAWVVNSSRVGLQSVQYYTQAIRAAAHQLSEMTKELANSRNYVDRQRNAQNLQNIIAAAQYIEYAAQHQEAGNQKLITALTVATQVTEQISLGVTSATDAATQLQQVAQQLRSVVGN